MTWRARRLSVSSRGARPKPPSPRASSFFTTKRIDRSKNSRATFITRTAIWLASPPWRSSWSRRLRNSKGRAASAAGGPASAAPSGEAFFWEPRGGARRGRLGQPRQDVGHELRREGREIGLELPRVELAEGRLEDEGLHAHLPRAQAQRLVEALRHHQHRRPEVHLPEALHHLEAAVEGGAARGRHAEIGDEDERAVPRPQETGGLRRLVRVPRLDDLGTRRRRSAGPGSRARPPRRPPAG